MGDGRQRNEVERLVGPEYLPGLQIVGAQPMPGLAVDPVPGGSGRNHGAGRRLRLPNYIASLAVQGPKGVLERHMDLTRHHYRGEELCHLLVTMPPHLRPRLDVKGIDIEKVGDIGHAVAQGGRGRDRLRQTRAPHLRAGVMVDGVQVATARDHKTAAGRQRRRHVTAHVFRTAAHFGKVELPQEIAVPRIQGDQGALVACFGPHVYAVPFHHGGEVEALQANPPGAAAVGGRHRVQAPLHIDVEMLRADGRWAGKQSRTFNLDLPLADQGRRQTVPGGPQALGIASLH